VSHAAPLAGIRILDLTHMLSGPYASMLLGDLGADVVKVESPSRPDRARSVPPYRVGDQSAYYLSLNRNKRSVALDLKELADRRRFLELVRTADVVFENFRPGVADRLGLDRSTLESYNPQVIVCSLSGFGQTGPWRDRPAYDYLVQALAGTMSLTGDPDGPPTKYGVSVVDHVGGLFAVIGILSAVVARQNGSGAQTVDISLFDSHLSLLSYLAGWQLNCGATPTRQPASAHPTLVPSQAFETADGHIVVMVLADHFWAPMCAALDLPQLADDPRFTDAAQRLTHRDELLPILVTRLREHTTQQWVDALTAAGVPCAPVQSVPEALDSEQVRATDMVVELQHPHYGGYRAVANPLRFPDAGPLPTRPAPVFGEHTDELLSEQRQQPDQSGGDVRVATQGDRRGA
jgi:crotonobetainyl-CoA:carnitine CoA-transferase CaiB-like acyl-CoA transferase